MPRATTMEDDVVVATISVAVCYSQAFGWKEGTVERNGLTIATTTTLDCVHVRRPAMDIVAIVDSPCPASIYNSVKDRRMMSYHSLFIHSTVSIEPPT
jgi:hypothetical protein